MYVLGIDGGGTTTTGVIANSSGEVLAKARVGSSNMNSTSKSLVKQELAMLFKTLQSNKMVYSKVGHVFAGMAGVRDEATKGEMEDVLKLFLHDGINVTVDTDAITALYSGTLGAPGIVQIAGTGAITYGENAYGKRARAGGWGHLFSDYGSGYSLGKDGLDAAFMSFDGVKEQTAIVPLLLAHYQVEILSDIIQRIYRHENPKKEIASLSRLVVEAAEAGDQVAKDIINTNGHALGASIASLLSRLFGNDRPEKVPVVLTGGIFNLYDMLKDAIENAIPASVQVDFILPKVVPVCGAVIAGFKVVNVSVSPSFLEDFYTSY